MYYLIQYEGVFSKKAQARDEVRPLRSSMASNNMELSILIYATVRLTAGPIVKQTSLTRVLKDQDFITPQGCEHTR